MSNLVKAVLIINAKKGWSNEARVKAAAKRKMKFSQFKEKTLAKAQKKADSLFKEAQKLHDKGMSLIHDSNQVWGSRSDTLYKKADRTMRQGDTALYQAESLSRRVKKVRDRSASKGITSNAKKKQKSEKCPDCGTKMVNGSCPECDEPTENAKKKGWSDAARKKAAATRKRKSVKKNVDNFMKRKSSAVPSKLDLRTPLNKVARQGASAKSPKSVNTVKQSRQDYSLTPGHVPKKGHYIDFYGGQTKSGGHILHGVKVRGDQDSNVMAARKRVEKALGKKLKIDPRTGFPSFSLYKNGKEIGAG